VQSVLPLPWKETSAEVATVAEGSDTAPRRCAPLHACAPGQPSYAFATSCMYPELNDRMASTIPFVDAAHDNLQIPLRVIWSSAVGISAQAAKYTPWQNFATLTSYLSPRP